MVKAAISAGNRVTAEAGAEIVRAGGNAVDAVVAAGLASFLAEPLLASAGGAGMLTLVGPGSGPQVLDFFSRAPGLSGDAGEPHFESVEIDFGSATQTFHVGRGSAAAPLALPGLAEAARRFGNLPLTALIEPARRLALEGFTVEPETAHVFRLLWPIMARDPQAVALYGENGGPPSAGHVLYNPGFARILESFAQTGSTPDEMRSGLLEGFGPSQGGLLGAGDLDQIQPTWQNPHQVDLGHGIQMMTSPHPGGQLVGIITEHLLRMPEMTATWIQEHRDQALARELLWMAQAAREGHLARDRYDGRGCTTQISVIDQEGGAASMTLTNGEGSGHLIAETGIQANNFLGEEDLNPHGFHQHAPGTVLPTMLAPTILTRDGQPYLATGSGGANRIRSAVSDVIFRLLRGSVSHSGSTSSWGLHESIASPRVHAEATQAWFESPTADPSRDADLIQALQREFDEVYRFPEADFFFGGVHSVLREGSGLAAIGDSRRGGYGVVVE